MRRVAIVGPTAVGKSELAVALAARLGAEIVNADSMQLYRGMDIGTAKLPVSARLGIPHHLFDVLDVTQDASVAAYQRDARACLDGLSGRRTGAILVGGSGLYLTAALDDLVFPATDPTLRADLEAELDVRGALALHHRLAQLDPAAAAKILPGNARRTVRALEVIALTGRPYAASLPQTRAQSDVVRLGLSLPREALDARIADRVERMWSDGLVEEVAGLVGQGLRDGHTAARALGYAQVLRLIDGELTDDQAKDETIRATRRYVRRQLSWWRRDQRIIWLDAADPGLLAESVRLVEAR